MLSFILAGAVQGLFMILLLNAKEKTSGPDKLLMLWFGIMAAQLLFYYDNLSPAPIIPPAIQLMAFTLPVISSSVIYLYIFSLSFGGNITFKNSYRHLAPFILLNLAIFIVNRADNTNVVMANGLPLFGSNLARLVKYFIPAVLAVVPGYYTILSLFVLLKYQRLLPGNYSNTEKITLNWLKDVVISLLVLFVGLFLLIRFGVNYGLLSYANLFEVVGCVLSFYVFFIGYFGLRQTIAFTALPNTIITAPVDPKISYKNSGLTAEAIKLIFENLQLHMAANKPYLDEELTLPTLAGQLGITPNQLSQVINQHTGSSFYYFVNGYRIAAVKAKLKDPAYAHYSIIGIGYDCGFRSKSSLNKVFKEIEGVTPSQYQKCAVI